MFDDIKRKLDYVLNDKRNPQNSSKTPLTSSLTENMIILRKLFPNSMDLNNRELEVGKTKVQLISCEGMISMDRLIHGAIEPLNEFSRDKDPTSQEVVDFILNKSIMSQEQKQIFSFEELLQFIMAGFVAILIDGEAMGVVIGMQGFNFRSISEPTNEVNELGSKEAFVEAIRINLSMIRRRLKSPNLRFEPINVGTESKTDVCLIYLADRVSHKALKEVRKKVSRINLDMILDSSYVRPYLENHPFSLFSSVGTTERPDTLCGKINEGRIALLVDGSPYALIVPFLFSENFKSFDDYAHRPYFATFVRILKYLSFYISFLLPGGYVAVSTFHPELLPHALLFSVAAAEETTPFSLMLEALFIYLVFEIMREAGIRLPSAVGHTIGIVGALVIGDAAVNAGLIGAPMVMVVAITAICAFSIPQLYEPIMLLRFLFIILGGISGLFGIALGSVCVSAKICSMNSLHIPMTAPLSPLDYRWLSDSVLFAGIRKIAGKGLKIQNVTGSEIKDGEGEDD
ncbi:MAG: spore germination protein [Oscillospiraceae bacterium]|nr:spore germination protein [Oscillospiraceae bacterium]